MPISAAISSGVGLPAEVLVQLPLDPGHLVDRLDHVHRDPDRPRLVGDRPGDRLPDPPGGVGGELVALGVVELLHRPDQAQVALLDQVEEDQPAADVALGDRHHQPQVGLDQPLLGPHPVGRDHGPARRARSAARGPPRRGQPAASPRRTGRPRWPWPAPPRPARSAAAPGRSPAGRSGPGRRWRPGGLSRPGRPLQVPRPRRRRRASRRPRRRAAARRRRPRRRDSSQRSKRGGEVRHRDGYRPPSLATTRSATRSAEAVSVRLMETSVRQ